MPGLDRTGPEGQGSRTGRQMGKCAPKQEESDGENGFGKALGRGRGRGFGKGPGRGLGRRGRG